jgi:hypothetical protein
MDINTKANVADMMATLHDLKHSNKSAKIIGSGKYHSSSTEKRALYESAIISYRRALKGDAKPRDRTNKKAWFFPEEQKTAAKAGMEIQDAEIFYIANKIIAHRACKEALLVTFPIDSDWTIQAKYIERLELMPALIQITDYYITILLRLIPEIYVTEESHIWDFSGFLRSAEVIGEVKVPLKSQKS